jgi:hypothetical protein
MRDTAEVLMTETAIPNPACLKACESVVDFDDDHSFAAFSSQAKCWKEPLSE